MLVQFIDFSFLTKVFYQTSQFTFLNILSDYGKNKKVEVSLKESASPAACRFFC